MSPKTRELYEAIRDSKISSDLEAVELLYDKSDEKDPAYRKLKYRLKQRLINTLFFIDIQSYSRTAYEKALNRSLKNWCAFKILLDKGIKKASIDIAENVLKNSIKYDLIELSLLILKDLRFQYGLLIDNKYKFDKYTSMFEEMSQLFKLKCQIEDKYIVLGQILTKTKTYKYDESIAKIENELIGIRNVVLDYDSYFLKFYWYNSVAFVYLIKKDNESLYNLCQEALEYFDTKKDFSLLASYQFNQKKAIALLCLQRYDESKEIFSYCFSFISKTGGIGWQYNYRYLFINQILLYDYQSAYDIVSIVLNDPNFNNLNESFREPWYLKEAFINFLIKIDKIDPDKSNEQNLRTFRINRFLNEVNTYAREKRGLNITINIIQMLFLIIDEKFDQVLDKLTALRQYNFRYLKRPEYSRSSNFIKMLLKIPEGDYKASQIRKKAKRYHKALLENPSDYSEHALSLEIIPYEQLWEEIMSIFPE